MTGMTGMTRKIRMTWLQGSYPVLIKKFKYFIKVLFKDKFPILQGFQS